MALVMAATPVYYGYTESDGDRKVVKAPMESVATNEGGQFWMPVEPAGISSLGTADDSDTYWQSEATYSYDVPESWFFGTINDGIGGEDSRFGGWQDSDADNLWLCHRFSWW